MRYLSVCSGIEAASVAWHHLGWTPVGFSEIEPFPAAVLAHRFPNVPNYGDMTKYEQWPLQPGSIDVLVGGTPCQSFSVAGLRKGLEDPRGNLMLTYLAIAARLRPRWIVWENVPGVLSSNGGRDFGTFLGALGELRYGFAYRVLDAQYVRVGRWPRAVPQRRRRVFVVGCLGDGAAAAEVLALREGLQRHLEASGKARKGAASDAEGGARGGGVFTSHRVAPCLETTSNDYSRADGFTMVAQPTAWPAECAGTLGQSASGSGSPGYSNQEIFSQHGANLVPQPVPYDLFQITAPVNRQNRKPGDPCHTLARDNAAHAAIAIQGNLVGRETGGPQGVGASTDGAMYTLTKADMHAVAFTPGNLARGAGASPNAEVFPTLKCSEGRGADDQRPCVAFPIDTQNMTEGHSSGGLGFGQSGDPSFTVTKGHSHAVAHAAVAFDWQSDGDSRGLDPKDTAQLQRCQTPAVAFANRTRDGIKMPEIMADGVTPALTNPGCGGRSDAINVAVASTMTVRRLTPVECERLQGFPDDWTAIPWRKKPAEECPDGPRYKALGNSMACNCMALIGERIAAYEQRGRVDPTPAGTAGIAPAGDLNHEGDRHG